MSFSELGLSDAIVRAVTEHGYTIPTPIQRQAIPAVLAGGDLLAGAQTGTGKTAGFTLPLLHRLSQRAASSPKVIRALILTPTRELAAQVEESVRTYGKYVDLTSTVIFGGVNINPQTQKLRRGVDILVATPGRLLDHLQQGTLSLSHVETLILDEADRMLDMGFIRDIKKILALLPRKRQNLLFSATFSDEIKTLADSLLNAPAMIEVARRNATVEIIKQKIYPVDRDKKQALLAHLITEFSWFQVLVFTRTKHGANKLVEQLVKAGIGSMAIHGNKSQAARTRALAEFKTGELQVLVATDIAARGIDIDQLPYVVNYDLPNVPEDYVHRIGRTGRAGATGEAISLVCVDEHEMLRDIEKLIKQTLPKTVIAGFEPDPNARAQPIQLRSNDHMNGGFGGSRNNGRNPGRGGSRSSGDRGAEGGQRPAARGESKPRSATGGANAGAARTSAAGTGGNGNTARPARSASAPRTGGAPQGRSGPATGGPGHRSGGRGR